MKSVVVFYLCHSGCCLTYVRCLASSLFRNSAQCTDHAIVSDINISRGSVVTHLRCGGIFNDCFIATFLESGPAKEFSNSVNIWRRYKLEYVVYFLLTHSVVGTII